MKQINLKTTSRTQVGGNSAKRYRKSGQVPAVIYGESGEKHLLINNKDLSAALKSVAGKAVLIEMTFDDGTESRYAMLKDVERHPISEAPLHVDFVEVVRGKPMHAVLPLHFTGEAYGVKNENGVIEIHEHEVRVKCRPRDLPEMIVIDISNLKVGEGIHLKDVKAPEGVEFTSDLEDLLVTCNLIKVEEEPAPAAEGAEDDAAKAAAPAEADSKSAPAAKK
ncbi:50S ribosomal protein L25 [Coraliomargarita sp. CAG:312]|nr:50S ribosomal protein L25 [Coraliomargarita sp. CAG:312]